MDGVGLLKPATFSLHIAEASLLSGGLSDFPKLGITSGEMVIFREYTNSVRSTIKSNIRFCGLLIKIQRLVTPNKRILTLIRLKSIKIANKGTSDKSLTDSDLKYRT